MQEETDRTDRTGKVDVKITGLIVGSDEVTVVVTGHWDWLWHRDLGCAVLNKHCYVDWRTEVLKAGSLKIAPLAHCTTFDEHCSCWLQTVFITDFASIDHCIYVQICDTESLNQCQGEVQKYMRCTHTTVHSTVLSSILTAWLKSLCKKDDWID